MVKECDRKQHPWQSVQILIPDVKLDSTFYAAAHRTFKAYEQIPTTDRWDAGCPADADADADADAIWFHGDARHRLGSATSTNGREDELLLACRLLKIDSESQRHDERSVHYHGCGGSED